MVAARPDAFELGRAGIGVAHERAARYGAPVPQQKHERAMWRRESLYGIALHLSRDLVGIDQACVTTAVFVGEFFEKRMRQRIVYRNINEAIIGHGLNLW